MRYTLLLCWALVPGVVHALGLGNIELQSALNEPLQARIELLSATAEDINSLNVGLADAEAFNRAGVPREFVLTQLQFSIKDTETGPDYILVTTDDPVREPYLDFLVEINWSNGRLYREYTVLLDPPIYADDEMPRKITVPSSAISATREDDTVAREEHTVVHYPEYKPPSEAGTTGYVQATDSVQYAGGDYGPVASGETLWSIARAMRPDRSVSIQQMMLALLRANPEAFINGNINGLKRGFVLKNPELSDTQSLEKSEAFKQAEMQNAMWQEARQAVAAAPPVRPEGTPEAPAESPQQPAVVAPEEPAEKPAEAVEKTAETEQAAPVVVEPQPELRLVAPATTGQSATQGGAVEPGNEALAKELALASETLEALKLENIELQDKITESDVIVSDLKRLITLKETELATLQQQVADRAAQQAVPVAPAPEAPLAETAPVQESAKPQTAAPAEVKPEPSKPAKPPKPAKKKGPSIVSTIKAVATDVLTQLKNNLLYILGALAAAAVVFAVIYAIQFVQRRRSSAEFVSSVDLVNDGEGPGISLEPVGSEDVTDMNLESAGEGEQEAITIQPSRSAGATGKTRAMGETADKTQIMGMGAAAEKTQIMGAAAMESARQEVSSAVEDPLEEVNVFLAYEHFDQAEDFVKKALEKEPQNPAFHVKLLEVYYTANNRKNYEQEARVLHDLVQGKGDHWGMAQAMWQVLSPGRALFAAPGAGEEVAEAPDTKEAGGILNIAGEGGATTSALDFDLDTTGGGAGISDTLEVEAPAEAEMLDVTAAAAPDSDVLEFSTAAENEISGAAVQETVATSADDNALDFSLDLDDKSGGDDQTLEKSVDQLQEDTGASVGEDNALDFSLDLEDKSAGEDQSLDLSMEHEDTGISPQPPDDNALDFSLVMDDKPDEGDESLDMSMEMLKEDSKSPSEHASDDNALDFSLDMESPASEEMTATSLDKPQESGADLLDVTSAIDFGSSGDMEGSKSGSSLLDITSTMSLNDIETQNTRKYTSASGEDLMDVSKPGAPGRGADLLDVTSAPVFALDKGKDLMDVTFTGSASSMGNDNDNSGLDFELSPDQPVPGDDAAMAFDGIDITSASSDSKNEIGNAEPVSAEDAFAVDMESTMQIPNKRSVLAAKEKEEDDDQGDKTFVVPRKSTEVQSDDDEIATQMDLAKAYIELGNADSAKTILDEVIAIGNEAQRRQAQALLGQIG